MKIFASLLGISALVAAIVLLVLPFGTIRNTTPQTASVVTLASLKQPVQTPLGELRSFSEETDPLRSVGVNETDKAKANRPNIYAHLALKEKLLTPQEERARTASRELNADWKSWALSCIPRVENNYGSLIRSNAAKRGLDPEFVTAIVVVESCGNPKALSSVGARGLMQIMPATAEGIGISGSLWSPSTNIEIGTAYLASLRYRHGFGRSQAAVAYNAGPGYANRLSESAIQNFDYTKKVTFVLGNL